MKTQSSNKHYFESSYDSKERFVSYWNQTSELIKLRCNKYLEIGIGNSLVSDYLKKRNYCITTMEFDPTLNPNVIGSIEKLPFANESFDAVACFEVLEHFPYEQTHPILKEIYRVTKKICCLVITRRYPHTKSSFPFTKNWRTEKTRRITTPKKTKKRWGR